jgi:L-lactate utilization protein LutB
MGKKKSKIKSACCKAPIISSEPAPDFIGDKNPSVGTCCCICTKCNKPCNFYIPIRRTWTINPKTKVKGDEREELTKKEIKKILKEEDF